uniref:Ovule protein n=1 Tax=Caenorhabditis tropicalis TaxID=1561998 RepID=A0A1I7TNF6_9PELO
MQCHPMEYQIIEEKMSYSSPLLFQFLLHHKHSILAVSSFSSSSPRRRQFHPASPTLSDLFCVDAQSPAAAIRRKTTPIRS